MVINYPPRQRFKLGILFQYIVIFIIIVALAGSECPSKKKLHCTAENCDVNEEKIAAEETAEKPREDGVHLAYDCVSPEFTPEEEVPVIMLHGLTDTKSTWDGIYQNIPILTHRKACVYDARNHGDSSWNSTFTIDILAEDLGHLMDQLKIERAVLVGHSMGGLTAMTFALNNPGRVEGLFIEDISPAEMEKDAMVFVRAWLDLLKHCISAIPGEADETTAQKAVMDCITKYFKHAPEPPPENFVKNAPIRWRDGSWQWKANLDAANKAIEDPYSFFSKPEGSYDGKTFFIYGKTSLFRVGNQEKGIRKLFPNSEFFGVEKAGHMIHSRFSEFVTKLVKFLH